MWYKYAMGYYLVIKRNKCESVELQWRKLDSVTQSEVSQKEKNKNWILTHIYGSDQISRSVVSDSFRPHESQHARPPYPSPTPRVH